MPRRSLPVLALAALSLLPLSTARVAAAPIATPAAVVQADLDALNANDLDAFMADTATPGQVKELVSVLRVRDGRVLDLWPLQRRIDSLATAQASR